jgi:hypothetical protein
MCVAHVARCEAVVVVCSVSHHKALKMQVCVVMLLLLSPLSWALAPCPGETRGDRYGPQVASSDFT